MFSDIALLFNHFDSLADIVCNIDHHVLRNTLLLGFIKFEESVVVLMCERVCPDVTVPRIIRQVQFLLGCDDVSFLFFTDSF